MGFSVSVQAWYVVLVSSQPVLFSAPVVLGMPKEQNIYFSFWITCYLISITEHLDKMISSQSVLYSRSS